MLLYNIVLGMLTVSLFSLIYLWVAQYWIRKQDVGNSNMRVIADRIGEGALSFLRTEYKYVAVVVGCTSCLLWLLGWCDPCGQVSGFRVFNYVVGALLSMLAGFIGLRIATFANVRTAQAARFSLPKAFRISFVGGTVMGLGVVAFALLGMGLLLLMTLWVVSGHCWDLSMFDWQDAGKVRMLLEVLTGFALGAETMAFFARVAGGIYTKAADVGADIVGKTEVGIPEDDPRNPATIADNVGDNVGDIAGMGADLLGSYISTLLAAMVLGLSDVSEGGLARFLLPLGIASLGLGVCLVSSFFVRLSGEGSSISKALHVGNVMSMVLVGGLAYGLLYWIFPNGCVSVGVDGSKVGIKSVYGAIWLGIGISFVMGWVTELFTGMSYPPVRFIAKQSTTGAATNLIAGLSVGMFSTVMPMIIFSVGLVGAYHLAGFYGIAISAVSMMANTPMQLAMDAFGPIADNAGGIAEMAGLPEEVRDRTDALDAVGNTTAAAGKGYAIASAALTSLALFASFHASLPEKVTMDFFEDAWMMAGLFLGGMVPFLISGLIMNSVGKAAMEMVGEVRRQFKVIPGLLDGRGTPDYGACVTIATKAALREMILPGLITLLLPVSLGWFLGAKVLAAFLTGVVVVGTMMAIFQCNAGGAWDNAKKRIEKDRSSAMGKGSEAHKAAVIGDTVGDPFKDTSGPTMNILIKVTIIVALIMVGYLR